jgi:drug efflux transport system ATP-binding protein
MANDGAAAIVLDAVMKRFTPAGPAAVDGISARLPAGGITGLVGPDGAGKTTLLRMMAGLLARTTGTVLVDGVDPAAGGAALRARLGYMPQKFGLYEDLTVRENLVLYADLHGVVGGERQAAFARLLAFTGLGGFTSRPAGKLSGGMKQKLGLACALLGSPRVLLLDEPSVGVDPISRRELWRMVGDLTAQGITVVWSTAYLDEAEACAHVLLLNGGRLLFEGAPKSLTARLADRAVQVRDIVGNRRAVLRRALRDPAVMDGVIQGRAVRLVLRAAGRGPDAAALDAGPGARIVAVPPRFEDAFIDLLGGGPGGESVLADAIRAHPPAPNEEAAIEARGLTKKFGAFVATDHVDFAVRRGEIFGLLGPNGAGKSTTFRMLCGLLKPTTGDARVMGIDLKTSAAGARQRLGYMAQKFSLYGNLSVRQNLVFFSGAYGLTGSNQVAAVDRMIDIFDLRPRLDAAADALPLGFKQRLALSCAVMHDPDVLFLDEPTSGVDPITRREFWSHINGVVDKGVTVMVTTHFMDEAEYCDRIGLVYRGRLIASGTPDALKEGVAGGAIADPSMEDAFVELVRRSDAERVDA